GPGDRANHMTHLLFERPHELLLCGGRVSAGFEILDGENDPGHDALPLEVVRKGNDSGFSDRIVSDEGTLDFGGANAMPRDIDDVVHPSGDPPVAIFVALAAIAGEVVAGEATEI